MATDYRILGAELSPYSVKVRSYFRYKGIPHEWILRTPATDEEFQAHAKLPLIPLVISSKGDAMQDSTPIIEKMEAQYSEPSILPPEPRMAFLSALLEEYADEWGNKHMFHYRWFYEPDQNRAAERIADMQAPDGNQEAKDAIKAFLIERMIPRLSFVGSSEATKGHIENSFHQLCGLLEAHLETRPYIFGGRPALADFGLWGQIYNAYTDPTAKSILEKDFPSLRPWIDRMLDPKQEGDWESWENLSPTLLPILKKEVAGLFLPWSDANAKALEKGEETFEVSLGGKPFRQNTQKYHARSLKALRTRFAASSGADLKQILEETECLPFLETKGQ